MRAIYVNVEQNDINLGLAHSCTYCPVAVAIRRRLGWVGNNVSIFRDGIHIRGWVGDYNIQLPPKVKRFVELFDEGEPVEPFKFKLKLVEN